MINRRDFLGLTVSAGAMSLAPNLLRALQRSEASLIQRAIPSSGEMLPVVGLSFSNHPACADHAALRAVLQAFADNGGRVFDAMHVSTPVADQFHTTAPAELGVQGKLFWSTRATPPGIAPQTGAAFVHSYIDTLRGKLKVSSIDLAMLPPSDPSHLAALKEERKAGRVRYIGVQVITEARFAELEAIMRNEPIDFIGVNYDVGNRRAEETILPLALERKIAVMAFFPFGNNGGVSCGSGSNLFGRVGSRPVPEWAAEFDATTWSHFFTKYVISHPAVTVARGGTTKPAHMLDNIGGGIGRLPDEATRRRMAALIDGIPPVAVQSAQGPPLVLPAAVLDRYAGDYRSAGGSAVTVRRYGTTLTAKPGPNPETILVPRSERRFSLGHRGPGVIEFQLDGAGNVAGLTYEHGNEKVTASRVR